MIKDVYQNYIQQDLENPTYFFHGSPKQLDVIKTNLSHDSAANTMNIDQAVFVTPSFLMASAYAFKDTIKENSKLLDWDFQIRSRQEFPIMTMQNVITDDRMVGYIYVFENNGSFVNEPGGSLQYKSFVPLQPCSVIPIVYRDFKAYYETKTYTKREK